MGGVALVISNKLLPMRIHLKTDIELVVAEICYPIEMYIISLQVTSISHVRFCKKHDKNIEGV